MKNDNDASPLDVAARYLSYKARSECEVLEHLSAKCRFTDDEIAQTISRLKELNYVNDQAFANDFITTRLNTKPVSRNNLRRQLEGHKISESSIEDAIRANVSDEAELENAYQVALKYYDKMDDTDERMRRQRLIKRLITRGYDYSIAKRALDMADAEKLRDTL